jgi:hypothetical protein
MIDTVREREWDDLRSMLLDHTSSWARRSATGGVPLNGTLRTTTVLPQKTHQHTKHHAMSLAEEEISVPNTFAVRQRQGHCIRSLAACMATSPLTFHSASTSTLPAEQNCSVDGSCVADGFVVVVLVLCVCGAFGFIIGSVVAGMRGGINGPMVAGMGDGINGTRHGTA